MTLKKCLISTLSLDWWKSNGTNGTHGLKINPFWWMTLYQKSYVTATERHTRKCGHGWQNCSQLPPETGVGVRIPGTSVPQQPVLHRRQGNSLFCRRCGSCVQHPGAQAEILPGAQRWHNQVVWRYMHTVCFRTSDSTRPTAEHELIL